jgi:UDP-N-acetylmuramoyl-tripeptide--D-alanyl-D-alanine ligase
MDAGTDTEVLVVEMAMRGPGQIARLCSVVRPTVGLVTNVGVSHVELLGSQEAIASAKAELVRAVPADGHVFLNGDDAWSAAMAADTTAGVTLYGLNEAFDVRATDVALADDGTPTFRLVTAQGEADIRLSALGRHNVYNALAAAAVGLHLGLPVDDVVTGLASATFSKWRMETFESASGVTVINDAYNANPTSMRAALSALADAPASGKRVAVLGDMGELGSLSELAHFELGESVAVSAVDVLVTVGAKARRIAEGAMAAGMPSDAVRPCVTAAEATEVLDDVLDAGDTVLVKASRMMGLEAIVEGIMEPRVRPAT